MGAIANFKKQREAARAELKKLSEKAAAAVANVKHDKPADKKAAPVSEAKNEALTLLARLLGCEPEKAIEQAKELIETAEQEGFSFVIGFESTEDEQEPEPEKVTAPAEKTDGAADTLQASAEAVQDAAANVDDAAGSVNAAADSVSTAAGDLDDTAKQLAYSADDIGQATGELKKATEELKKPSAARQSSRGARTAKRKSSSKK
jgi:methyl-accepting chemotaxis protein